MVEMARFFQRGHGMLSSNRIRELLDDETSDSESLSQAAEPGGPNIVIVEILPPGEADDIEVAQGAANDIALGPADTSIFNLYRRSIGLPPHQRLSYVQCYEWALQQPSGAALFITELLDCPDCPVPTQQDIASLPILELCQFFEALTDETMLDGGHLFNLERLTLRLIEGNHRHIQELSSIRALRLACDIQREHNREEWCYLYFATTERWPRFNKDTFMYLAPVIVGACLLFGMVVGGDGTVLIPPGFENKIANGLYQSAAVLVLALAFLAMNAALVVLASAIVAACRRRYYEPWMSHYTETIATELHAEHRQEFSDILHLTDPVCLRSSPEPERPALTRLKKYIFDCAAGGASTFFHRPIITEPHVHPDTGLSMSFRPRNY